MRTETIDHQTIVYDPNLLSKRQIKEAFDANFWQLKNMVVGQAQGRGTTWFIQLETTQAALRHYRRGGLLGKLINDHYLYLGEKRVRSFQEFLLLQVLIDNKVNVPRPIAARVVRKGLVYQADLLSEKVPNASDLVDCLTKSVLDKQTYQNIGSEIRKMHNAQVNHTDLNIHNILVDVQEQVWLIDFDKCFQQSGNSWKKSNLERLKRSFIKEKGKRRIQWQESDWTELMIGYDDIL
ncbi:MULTISPECIES: 3-deoxy-D-manno-octulosonic acid kinase [unclassified Vibrio]|uniref:3-deoxy-D-manno-octulosonic acid kinase n=1 Tax=unclassified Vibrio TaxID=2614977 RepID=UPI0010BDCFA6|nr:3-deoxy-D-manno-octulosonic acid kinase [Vibrio sp. F13]TKG24598.1 3-deoxy-D-manno-octulosonic acid kinase [Vibrio sp. F13]